MLRIETENDGPRIILRLIGRVRADRIDELRERIRNHTSCKVLDLTQVDLIDLQSVRFLRECQDQKIELRNCAPYILEWIRRERMEGQEAFAEISAIAETPPALLRANSRRSTGS